MKLIRTINSVDDVELLYDDPEGYGESIKIVLRDNTVFRIYERRPGVLELSVDRVLHIEPHAINAVHLRSTYDSFELDSFKTEK